MGGLSAVAIRALEPFVGPMAASTCVRATAIAIGKTADELGAGDLPTLETNVRRLLGPVAPVSVIDQIVNDIKVVADFETEA